MTLLGPKVEIPDGHHVSIYEAYPLFISHAPEFSVFILLQHEYHKGKGSGEEFRTSHVLMKVEVHSIRKSLDHFYSLRKMN